MVLRVLTTRHNTRPPRSTAPPRSEVTHSFRQWLSCAWNWCEWLRIQVRYHCQLHARSSSPPMLADVTRPAGYDISRGSCELARRCKVLSYAACSRRSNTRISYRIRSLDAQTATTHSLRPRLRGFYSPFLTPETSTPFISLPSSELCRRPGRHKNPRPWTRGLFVP